MVTAKKIPKYGSTTQYRNTKKIIENHWKRSTKLHEFCWAYKIYLRYLPVVLKIVAQKVTGRMLFFIIHPQLETPAGF